jgi:hypothetical protein
MGCGSSKIFMVNETVQGQNSEAMRAFKLLELSDGDIETFFLAFQKFDVINDGTIEINEFLPRLGLGMFVLSCLVLSCLALNYSDLFALLCLALLCLTLLFLALRSKCYKSSLILNIPYS